MLQKEDGNIPGKYKTIKEEFPLRGHLICLQCNGPLTASASKGKMGTLFYYYHCSKGCKERQKACVVNQAFVELLKSIQPNEECLQLFTELVKDRLEQNNSNSKTDLIRITKDIDKQKQRIANGKTLMLDGEITASDFKEMKSEIEDTITRLTVDLSRAKLL